MLVFNVFKFCFVLFVCLISSSATRLYRGRAPRQGVWQFCVLSHMRQSWETMTSVSAGHIILTPTHPEQAATAGNLTPDLLTGVCTLYRLSYRAMRALQLQIEKRRAIWRHSHKNLQYRAYQINIHSTSTNLWYVCWREGQDKEKECVCVWDREWERDKDCKQQLLIMKENFTMHKLQPTLDISHQKKK